MGGRGTGSRANNVRSTSNSMSTSSALQNRSSLTPEGQKAFDILERNAGGVWRVMDASAGRNVLMSNQTFTREEADARLSQIRADIRSSGIRNSISEVAAYWSTSSNDGRELRISITMKRNNSNYIGNS